MSTIFTKIIAGELPSYKIYEDEFVLAILDINPIQKGHSLVIPKVEVNDLFSLDEKMYDHVMHRVRYVSQLLKAKFDCARVCILVEGYNIPHAHVHLVPTNSPADFEKKLAYVASKEELEEVHKLLTCS